MWKLVAATLTTIAIIANCLIVRPAFSAADKDSAFVWPKDSRFDCKGSLVREDGILRLIPDQGMLTWCDADIDGNDEQRVLAECRLNQECRISGVIRGHGAFGWVRIFSVQTSTGGAVHYDLTELEARAKAAEILKGDPYGKTAAIAATRIRKAQLLSAGRTDCGDAVVSQPVWQFRVLVPPNVVSHGNEKIDGYLVLDSAASEILCASLPFLD